jgi:hypothetical protein
MLNVWCNDEGVCECPYYWRYPSGLPVLSDGYILPLRRMNATINSGALPAIDGFEFVAVRVTANRRRGGIEFFWTHFFFSWR